MTSTDASFDTAVSNFEEESYVYAYKVKSPHPVGLSFDCCNVQQWINKMAFCGICTYRWELSNGHLWYLYLEIGIVHCYLWNLYLEMGTIKWSFVESVPRDGNSQMIVCGISASRWELWNGHLWNVYVEMGTIQCYLWNPYLETGTVKCYLWNLYLEMGTIKRSSAESVPSDGTYQMFICGIYLEMRTIAFPYWNFSRRYNSFEQFTRLQET